MRNHLAIPPQNGHVDLRVDFAVTPGRAHALAVLAYASRTARRDARMRACAKAGVHPASAEVARPVAIFMARPARIRRIPVTRAPTRATQVSRLTQVSVANQVPRSA